MLDELLMSLFLRPSDPGAPGPADQGVRLQDSRERLQRRPAGRAGPMERPHNHAVPAGPRRPHLRLPGRAQRVSTKRTEHFCTTDALGQMHKMFGREEMSLIPKKSFA